jgi:hypothetical protein
LVLAYFGFGNLVYVLSRNTFNLACSLPLKTDFLKAATGLLTKKTEEEREEWSSETSKNQLLQWSP